jgi:hypothetical protein
MRPTLLYSLLALLIATSTAAQPRPIFDPDDFVDPRDHEGSVFISRLVIGGAWNLIDNYRPLHQDAGFIHVANNFYWKRVQFDYKHSRVVGEDPPPVQVCACSPPTYFPTPSPANVTPEAPPAGSKDFLQFGWYQSVRNRSLGPPVMLRFRLSWSRQAIKRNVALAGTNDVVSHLSAREQSFGLDADTYLRIAGHDIFGSIQYGRTVRSGKPDPRNQNELTYTNRFPAVVLRKWRIVVRSTLAVGGISDRGGTAINLVNPYFEAFLHERHTQANFHLVWSPQWTRSAAGWETHHQIALFVDRALFVKLFGSRRPAPAEDRSSAVSASPREAAGR